MRFKGGSHFDHLIEGSKMRFKDGVHIDHLIGGSKQGS